MSGGMRERSVAGRSRGGTKKTEGCPDCARLCERDVDALAPLDFVREVLLELHHGELLQAVLDHVRVQLRREHRGDVVRPVREHHAEARLRVRPSLFVLVLKRAQI